MDHPRSQFYAMHVVLGGEQREYWQIILLYMQGQNLMTMRTLGGFAPGHNHGFRKGFDEDTSNRSSSGSAISNPESCAQYGSADASDLTGPSQSVVWDTMVPSKKRTCIRRSKPSPFEKITKDLYTIWHEQQSSCFSATSEEQLLLESDKPMVSVEIGHGSVLVRHPNGIGREEESEASSLSVDNKQHPICNAYSQCTTLPVHIRKPAGQGMEQQHIKRSSSGSAISNPESCAQYGSADASDLTGPSQSVVWDTMVPSKKRTCIRRSKPSPFEKITKDLYTIWHERQSSCFSATSEEQLLLESDKPMVSVEIGHGSVLVRHPNGIGREEESEASSLSVDNKQHPICNAYSQCTTLPVHIRKPAGQGMEQQHIKRDKDQAEKLQMVGRHNSPLLHVDLQVSYESEYSFYTMIRSTNVY
ncbi:GATA transcription factor 26 [Olea europaea subsp. europaea]|uniref:GATA transcription factor 26 n=1 Tax=Olea europaea subsp. europaea TaxID=158383 RepID=A0A8S0T411_OLEEU|nr:GATA transcription factor 26 [Olea europaea subsp. europaea]